MLNVQPIVETFREFKNLKETPIKDQIQQRRDTSPRNSVATHLVVPRSSKAVPLQSPIDTETPYSVAKAKEDERGWSGIYKHNLFTNESNDEPLANLVQGDSYDNREISRDDRNKNLLRHETPGLSTFDTRTDIRKSKVSDKPSKNKKSPQKYKGQQRPFPTESSDQMISEPDYECIENSISYDTRNEKDSLYDET